MSSATGPGMGKAEPHAESSEKTTAKKNQRYHREYIKKKEELTDNALRVGREGGREEFPAEYVPAEYEKDTKWQLKQDLLADDTKFKATVPFGEKDMKYILDKRKAQERLDFDNWFSNLFDTTDPNKARLAQEIYPDFYNARESFIDRQAELQKRLAKIKLRGPKDLGDLQLIYMMQRGEVDLRNVPLWRLNEESTTKGGDLYVRGLFSPYRFTQTTTAIPQSRGGRVDGIPDIPLRTAGFNSGSEDFRGTSGVPGTWGKLFQ